MVVSTDVAHGAAQYGIVYHPAARLTPGDVYVTDVDMGLDAIVAAATVHSDGSSVPARANDPLTRKMPDPRNYAHAMTYPDAAQWTASMDASSPRSRPRYPSR